MSAVTLAASWTEDELLRLKERRKRFSREEAELLERLKFCAEFQRTDEDWRWVSKQLKEQVKFCQQNVKCCTLLLDYFYGIIEKPKVSQELEPVFLLCCGELEYGTNK